MNRKKQIRCMICFISLSILTMIFFTLNLLLGSSNFSLSGLIDILSGDKSSAAYKIITDIRLPRAAAALLLGGALSVSGFMLQTFFANPIAGPFVLGISSGAKLTVALAMIFTLQHGIALNSAMLVAASFIGSLVSMGAVLLISGRVKNMAQLIIGGIMIGYICSAVTELVVTFADDSNIVNLHNWSMGSFSGTDHEDVLVIAVLTLLGTAAAFMLSKPMGAYQLGESYAENSGVNIRFFKAALILLSSILSACVTAFAGPVSFVGVAVPHLMKGLFSTAKPIIIIPASFIGGGAFCLMCDLLARTVFAPTELSISTVTAIFGAPVVLTVMIKRRSRQGGN